MFKITKKIHLKKLDPSGCLIDSGLRWIYASIHTYIQAYIHTHTYIYVCYIHIYSLKHSGIKVKDLNDEIIWSRNKASKNFTTEMGYEVRIKEEFEREKAW